MLGSQTGCVKATLRWFKNEANKSLREIANYRRIRHLIFTSNLINGASLKVLGLRAIPDYLVSSIIVMEQ